MTTKPKTAGQKGSAPKVPAASGDVAPSSAPVHVGGNMLRFETGERMTIKAFAEMLVRNEREYAKVKEYAALGAAHRESELKQVRADALRQVKEAQGLKSYKAVEAAFFQLPESKRGRDATALICKATKLKPDAVRKHLTTVRARIKAG